MSRSAVPGSVSAFRSARPASGMVAPITGGADRLPRKSVASTVRVAVRQGEPGSEGTKSALRQVLASVSVRTRMFMRAGCRKSEVNCAPRRREPGIGGVISINVPQVRIPRKPRFRLATGFCDSPERERGGTRPPLPYPSCLTQFPISRERSSSRAEQPRRTPRWSHIRRPRLPRGAWCRSCERSWRSWRRRRSRSWGQAPSRA